MSTHRDYTQESIERALDIHVREGRIKSWRGLDPLTNHYVIVEVWGNDTLTLRSLREAYVFVRALASADHAARGCCLPSRHPSSIHRTQADEATRQGPAGGAWDEDGEFPVADWRYEIANDDTRLSYADWVASQRSAS